MPELRKVCFAVNEIQYQKVKALPRSFNLSEKLRGTLDKILDGTREGCRRVFITNKDKEFYKLKIDGQEGKSLIKLSPIEGTTQQIIIPVEEGYWIKLTLKDKDGNEILDNTSIRPCIENIISGGGKRLDEYKYGELKRETGKLKRPIYIKPLEELVIYIEDIEKIQNIEFEFAVDLC